MAILVTESESRATRPRLTRQLPLMTQYGLDGPSCPTLSRHMPFLSWRKGLTVHRPDFRSPVRRLRRIKPARTGLGISTCGQVRAEKGAGGTRYTGANRKNWSMCANNCSMLQRYISTKIDGIGGYLDQTARAIDGENVRCYLTGTDEEWRRSRVERSRQTPFRQDCKKRHSHSLLSEPHSRRQHPSSGALFSLVPRTRAASAISRVA